MGTQDKPPFYNLGLPACIQPQARCSFFAELKHQPLAPPRNQSAVYCCGQALLWLGLCSGAVAPIIIEIVESLCKGIPTADFAPTLASFASVLYTQLSLGKPASSRAESAYMENPILGQIQENHLQPLYSVFS